MATQRNFLVVDNWHLDPMNERNDKSVNPLALDDMDSVVSQGHTDFIFKGSKDEEGGLFSPQKDYDVPSCARFFGSNRIIVYLMMDSLAQDEFDDKITLTQGQINKSLQINFENEAGMWDWDPNNPAKWEPTGFNVLKLINPGSNEFQSRCSTDLKTWSLDLLFCNGTTFTPGASLRRVPLNTGSGWTTQKWHPQEQAQIWDKANVPVYTIKRYLRTQLIMSDGPIPLGWY